MKRLLSIVERSLCRILGLDYRTLKERLEALENEVKTIRTMANRVERKVYREEERNPEILSIQKDLEMMIESGTFIPTANQSETLDAGELWPW
jgi:hypothetical protein